MKILIVEPYEDVLKDVERQVIASVPESKIEQLDATLYLDNAERLIEKKKYDLVILVHELPYGGPSGELLNEGYNILIPKIKKQNPNSIVIGMSPRARNVRVKPDYVFEERMNQFSGFIRAVLRKHFE